MNKWLLVMVGLFVTVEVVAVGFLDSFGSSLILHSLVFISLFFGFFYLFYGLHALGASMHDWVKEVRRMEYAFNPVYFAWLYEHRRREWSAIMTVVSIGFSIFLGSYLCFGQFSSEDSSIGFLGAVLLLIVVGLCWYKGFWEPRTEAPEPHIPQSVKAEWEGKRL